MGTTANVEKLTINVNDLIGDVKILFDYTWNPCQPALDDLSFSNMLQHLEIKISRKSGFLMFVPDKALHKVLQIAMKMLLRSSLEDDVRGLDCEYFRIQ